VFFDKLLQEINDKLDSITGFPGALDLRAQGVFTIGYYHQRQAFFTKSE
jgi:CRISPR-associated protein Csd1